MSGAQRGRDRENSGGKRKALQGTVTETGGRDGK